MARDINDVRSRLSEYARYITDPLDMVQAADVAQSSPGSTVPQSGPVSAPFVDSGFRQPEPPNMGVPDGAGPEPVNLDSDSDLVRTQAEAGFDEENQYPYVRGGAVKPVDAVAGYNPAAIGGQENYDVLSRKGPNMAAQGYQEQADIEAAEGQELHKAYDNASTRANDGAAAILANRKADQEEMRLRDHELKANTAKYTQDLADRGQFWRSPRAIFATIAAGLMELGSDKRGIGIQMLDNAVQQDFAQRKALADTHLGQLKSNLAGYREIAKDREGGDLLAQSEMYRMLALEIEKVASNFRGPKAQAKAKEMIGEYMTRSAAFAGEFAKRNLYVQPQLVDPRLAATMRNQPGYQNFGSTGTPAAAAGSGRPGPGIPGGPSAARGVVMPGRASEASKEAMETQKPGTYNIVQQAVQSARKKALYLAKGDHAKAFEIFNNSFAKEIEAISPIAQDKGFQEITANVRGLAAFSLKLSHLEQLYGKDKMDEVLGAIRSDSMKEADQLISRYHWDADDESKKKRTELLLLKQALQGNINSYIRSISGGAVSESEAGRLKSVIHQGSSYAEIRKFINGLGADNVAKRQAMMVSLSPRAKELLELRVGSGRLPNGETVNINVPGASKKGQ